MKRSRFPKTISIFCLISMVVIISAILDSAQGAEKPDFNLKWSCWSAPGSPFAKASTWPLREVEKRTNGRVKFEEYYLGTLVPGTQEISGVGKRMADTAVLFCPMNRETSLLAGVVTAPGVPVTTGDVTKDCYAMARNMHKMAKTSIEIQEDFAKKNLRLLWAQGGMPRSLLCAKIPFKKVDDFKGRKTRALGDEAKMVKHFGGAAVGLTSAEEYEGLSRGIVDFCVDNPVGALPWKLQEVTKYWTPMVIGYATFFNIMNLDTWKALPKDIQQIFLDVAEEFPDKFTEIYAVDGHPYALKVFKEAGVTFLEWPKEEQAKLDAAATPLAKEWAEGVEKRGLPGKKVLNQWAEVWGRKPVFPE